MTNPAQTATLPLIPYPRQLTRKAGQLAARTLRPPPHDAPHAREVAELLRAHGYALDEAARAEFALNLDPLLSGEAYRLHIGEGGVVIGGGSEAGVFYGLQTLRQLLEAGDPLPYLDILDGPQFRWRGLMLDVARHFMPLPFVKKLLDLLARHKLNVFHLHLSDDQGWRMEIERYPRLTEIGAWRGETLSGHGLDSPRVFNGEPHGGFYTRDELRDLVAHAAARHITVVPEIDMPGHMLAAIAAYPQLGNHPDVTREVGTYWGVMDHVLNLEEGTFAFLENVLREVFEVFPGPYVHLGGDECPPGEWASPRARQRARELGLSGEGEMQPYFMRRMAGFLRAHGKHFVGWDEVIDNTVLERDAVIMAWRPADYSLEALTRGFPVVMAPNAHTYLDHYQKPPQETQQPLAIGGHLSWERLYRWNVYPEGATEDQRAGVVGAQVQVWTEYMTTPQQVEFMVFPRLGAFSEVVWSYPEARDTANLGARLKGLLSHLKVAHGPL